MNTTNTCKCGRHVPCRHCKQDWECFSDMSYYDMWCVRRTDQRGFGQGFHVSSQQEAVALTEMLNAMGDAIKIGIEANGNLIDLHELVPQAHRNLEWQVESDRLERNHRAMMKAGQVPTD